MESFEERYEFVSYHRDLEEFFMKHCSSLRSLKLKLWLHRHHMHYNALEIASRRVFLSSGDWILDRIDEILLCESPWGSLQIAIHYEFALHDSAPRTHPYQIWNLWKILKKYHTSDNTRCTVLLGRPFQREWIKRRVSIQQSALHWSRKTFLSINQTWNATKSRSFGYQHLWIR